MSLLYLKILFFISSLVMEENKAVRQKIAVASDIDHFMEAILELKRKYEVK